MTDEERRKRLIAELQDPSAYYVRGTCLAAADEIKRLAEERDQLAEQLADRPKPLPNLNSTSLQRDPPIKRS